MDTHTREMATRALRFLLIAFASVSVVLFLFQCAYNGAISHSIDFTSYVRASQWFFDGANPFRDVERRYIYPLFLLLVVSPFQFLMHNPVQKGAASAIWALSLYLSFFCTLAAAWKRIYGLPTLHVALYTNVTGLALMVVLFHPSLQDEFINGQVNLLVMGAMAAFFLLLERNRFFWAALFLAMATAVKIAPGLCLLYIVFDRRYRVALYYFPLVLLLTVGLPLLINSQSLQYYAYFFKEVMPYYTGEDLHLGYRAFSLISTISYTFDIHWYPPLKILTVGLLASALAAPIVFLAWRDFANRGYLFRLTVFGALVAILPITYPMSEPHHLLLQIIPFISIVAYWRHTLERRESVFHDGLSLLFIAVAIGLQIGHALKDTPIRLLSLMGLYSGMVLLLRKQKSRPSEYESPTFH